MNILMLTSVYPQPDDDDYKTTPTVEYFCKAWAGMGHKVIVIHNGTRFFPLVYFVPRGIRIKLEKRMQIQFPRESSRHELNREEYGVKIYRKTMRKLIPHGAFSKREIKKQGESIVRILEDNRFVPDLVIGHWANPQAALIAWLKQNYKKSNFISALVFHNDCYPKDVERYSLKEYLPYINVIGCRNASFGKMIRQNLGLDYSPFICYSGIPDETVGNSDIEKYIERKSENSIIYVGRLVKYKKLDAILSAISMCSNRSNITLEIVGSGSDKLFFEERAKELRLLQQLSFIDKLSREDVFKHMAKSECFTMISENEVFGMVYLEAMLMGCITIASKGSALDGIIINGVNGFLCKPGDAEELKNIYNTISSLSVEEKKSIMRNAHVTAKGFSDSAVAQKYLDDIMKTR